MALNALSTYHLTVGELDKALVEALKAKEVLEIIKEDKPSPSKAKYYFYAAKTYDQLNELEKSKEYYFLALNISKETGFATGVAIAEGSLGGYIICKVIIMKPLDTSPKLSNLL